MTFDNCFVVRNIKVIQSSNGLFIAMPSRKVKLSCEKCHFRNEAGSKFCNHCAAAIAPHESSNVRGEDAKAEHRDIAHPVTKEFREYLQTKVLEAYQKEAKEGGKQGDKTAEKETSILDSVDVSEGETTE